MLWLANPAGRYGMVQKGMIANLSMFLGIAMLVFAATHAQAGDIEPRTYANTQVGVNFLIAGYAYSEGGLSFPATVPIEGANIKIDTGILGYARSLDVWGNSGKFDVIVPYSDLSGSALVGG